MIPSRACARASAASKSSMATSHARPETCSATPPRAYTPAKTSDLEEDGFTLALDVDVELVAVLARRDEQGVAAVRRDRLEYRIAAVVLVGEVDPRDAAVEHPAREDVDVDVRRLAVADPPRLDRVDVPAALLVGRAAPDAAEAGR